ncbi:MAG: phosphohydrolase, partial [Thermodesulfobacteriota bacterium]|nr:phosphohydrolase [Thermodesulfobacteriota bacterium]
KGLHKLALVCERHVGVGITTEDIRQYNLPLPERNMEPVSIEEQIICYADKFFSKNSKPGSKEKSAEDIKKSLRQYGLGKVAKFQSWIDMFE